MPTVYLVVPCYNEEEVLPETRRRLEQKLRDMMESGRADADSRILFVDDGSKDKTWELRGQAAAETRSKKTKAQASSSSGQYKLEGDFLS